MAALIRYLLDTNILVHYLRGKDLGQWIETRYELQKTARASLLCEVSVGEIYSFALQNEWGKRKFEELESLLDDCTIVPLSLPGVHQAYAEIDHFSQQPGSGLTARNMGKNDLWIAAVARVTQTTLLTCDADFDHLGAQWINVQYIDPESVKKGTVP